MYPGVPQPHPEHSQHPDTSEVVITDSTVSPNPQTPDSLPGVSLPNPEPLATQKEGQKR